MKQSKHRKKIREEIQMDQNTKKTSKDRMIIVQVMAIMNKNETQQSGSIRIRQRARTADRSMGADLHVVVSVEGLVADGAGELGGPNEDL
jgi:hypothetical protein